jgi:hypothetical protein
MFILPPSSEPEQTEPMGYDIPPPSGQAFIDPHKFPMTAAFTGYVNSGHSSATAYVLAVSALSEAVGDRRYIRFLTGFGIPSKHWSEPGHPFFEWSKPCL